VSVIGQGLKRRLGRLQKRLAPEAPAILAYHRVFDCEHDVWRLNTPPSVFAEQIEALMSVRRVLPLAELLEVARSGEASDRPLAAVTFDDGYHDVFGVARPILERLDCPATVFVVSGLVDEPREFWWDELAFILLQSTILPAALSLTIDGRRLSWRLPCGDIEARHGVCNQVRRRWLPLSPPAIEAQLEALRCWAGTGRSARASHRVMSSCELSRLSGGVVTVGAHTVNHPSLPALDRTAQQAEISQSREALERIVGRPVVDFAYPYGHYDAGSIASVRGAQLTSACTVLPGTVTRRRDHLRLPRISTGLGDGESVLRAVA
jgi:peptidoglycan/xylan/chitin deacetylase (PgdA/CDA1 family)